MQQEGLKTNVLARLFLSIAIVYSSITIWVIWDYIFPIYITEPDLVTAYTLLYLTIFAYALMHIITGWVFLGWLIKIFCFLGEFLLVINFCILGFFVATEDKANVDAILSDIIYFFAPLGLLSFAVRVAVDNVSKLEQAPVVYVALPIKDVNQMHSGILMI